MSKLKDRGKRKRVKTGKHTVKRGVTAKSGKGGRNKNTKKTRSVLGKVFKRKKTLEELNKNVAGAKRARLKKEQEDLAKERKRQAAKKVDKLPTKKPKTISVKTKEKTIVKRKPPIKKVVKKKKKNTSIFGGVEAESERIQPIYRVQRHIRKVNK